MAELYRVSFYYIFLLSFGLINVSRVYSSSQIAQIIILPFENFVDKIMLMQEDSCTKFERIMFSEKDLRNEIKRLIKFQR